MKTCQPTPMVILFGIVTFLLAAGVAHAQGTTVWNGPTISFTHTDENGLQDQLTPGVALTRSSDGGGLYNAATESYATSGSSPADTEWAVGDLSDYATLTYGPCPLEAGNYPPGAVGTTYVVHLISEHIYFSLTLTGWGGQGGSGDKSFSYTRTTPVDPTIWNGPTVSFMHSDENGLQDQLTSGVALTRSSDGGGLYNAVTESYATSGTSPADTEWAMGDISDYATLSYSSCPLEAGNYPPQYVGTTFVVHLINENIYLSLSLTDWGGQGGSGDKTFAYTRTTAFVAPPTPTIGITNPVNGAVFASPANLKLGASASVSSGTVTNVQFFAGATLLGSVGAAPFNLTSGSLGTGSYALTAVATAAGISATSAVVNVSVVSPVTASLSGAKYNGGKFTFSYTANAGLSYVIRSSTNLLTWTPLATNMASGSPVLFTNTVSSPGARFYEVGRLPNP